MQNRSIQAILAKMLRELRGKLWILEGMLREEFLSLESMETRRPETFRPFCILAKMQREWKESCEP